MSSELLKRRNFLKKAALILSGSILASPLLLAKSTNFAHEEEKVAPDEDLMREHGILRRVMLIYREVIERVEKKKDVNPVLIHRAATIIQQFIENYHEKLEEEFLFPRFERAGQLIDLVTTLKIQHQKGKELTHQVLEKTKTNKLTSSEVSLPLILMQFIHMYEPHAAREDTVLFPAFRNIVSDTEYKELGEQFEDREHKLFGKNGFNEMVSQVADIEKELNIYELSKFTPN